ncbi:MAG: LacI family DNA-binding transcriptional regulator [Clostridia bacterium]|nr:LacI family DNA-binding transcriptional regulator [Clostridia bacterium]
MWNENKVRIKDIAEELGVSTATVSNVLHGKTQKISARTVKAVEKKLEERGYIPNMAATLLARNNSRIIGVVMNDHPKYEGHALEDPFLSAAVNHLSDEIDRRGYFMMLKKAKRMKEIVVFASMWNLDGMVLIGFCEDDYQDLRDRIRIPFVIYDGFFDVQNRFGNVLIDDFDGGRQVGSYLQALGHRRVLCLADNDVCMDRKRFDGLCEGLGTPAALWIIPMGSSAREAFYTERLPMIRSFSAVFAVSDFYAVELMRFLQRNGCAVPDEISIVGFDGSREAAASIPPLTTVVQDNLLRAKTAMDLLMQMIGKDCSSETICIPVRLRIAKSVKAVPAKEAQEQLFPRETVFDPDD